MSDNYLLLVPIDHRFSPTVEAAARAEQLLAGFVPEADDVTARFETEVTFFDCGQNWEGVQCSHCRADAASWWSDAVDRANSEHFTNLDVVAPCCGTKVSLNELHYLWPCAFGSFAIHARNPRVKDLMQHQEAQLANCLGSSLRKVWRQV